MTVAVATCDLREGDRFQSGDRFIAWLPTRRIMLVGDNGGTRGVTTTADTIWNINRPEGETE